MVALRQLVPPFLFAAVALASLLLRGQDLAEQDDIKLDLRDEVPSEESQETARELISDIYRSDFESATTPIQQTELAEKIYQRALKTSDDSAGQYGLLSTATDLAATAGDVDLALRITDDTNRLFKIDIVIAKGRLLTTMSRSNSKQVLEAVAQNALLLADETAFAENHRFAAGFALIAIDAGRSAKDGKTVADARNRHELFSNVATAKETLSRNPDDPKANLQVGAWYCFKKRNWRMGIAYLANGSDPLLKDLAKRDIANPMKVSDQVAIADDWWDAAENETGSKESALRERAAYWYKVALPNVGGLEMVKLEKRLASLGVERDAAQPANPQPEALNDAIVYFTFEEASIVRSGDKGIVQDQGKRRNNGHLFGTSKTVGPNGDALAFDGRRDYISLPILDDLENASELTIAFWINSRDRSNRNKMIFDVRDKDGQGDSVTRVRIFDSTLAFRTPGGEIGKEVDLIGGWHHVVCTWKNGTRRVFVDGELVGELTGGEKAITKGMLVNTKATVGTQSHGFYGPKPQRELRGFVGALDDFLILKSALSADAIKSLVQSKKLPK